MGNYEGYRKRSCRIINWWLEDEPEEKKKEVWYVYLLLEKATKDLKADPIGVLHDLVWDNNIFNIEQVEKLAEDRERLKEVVSRCPTRQKIFIKSHFEAILKAVEIHKNLSDENKSLLKELGYY